MCASDTCEVEGGTPSIVVKCGGWGVVLRVVVCGVVLVVCLCVTCFSSYSRGEHLRFDPLSIYLYIYHLSFYLSIYLSIYLSFYPSILLAPAP